MEPRRARDQLPTGHAFVYFKDWKVDCGDGVWYGFESEEVTVSIRRLRMYIYIVYVQYTYMFVSIWLKPATNEEAMIFHMWSVLER